MDDFNASTPEQRPLHNPNVEYVPFEEMKQRIDPKNSGWLQWVSETVLDILYSMHHMSIDFLDSVFLTYL